MSVKCSPLASEFLTIFREGRSLNTVAEEDAQSLAYFLEYLVEKFSYTDWSDVVSPSSPKYNFPEYGKRVIDCKRIEKLAKELKETEFHGD